MDHFPEHIIQLLVRHANNETLTPDDHESLLKWVADSNVHADLFASLSSRYFLKQALVRHKEAELHADKNWETVQSNIHQNKNQSIGLRSTHRVHFLKTAWFRWAAAVLIILGIGTYFWNSTLQNKYSTVVNNNINKNDILPGTNRAILTLSNGKNIELNNSVREIIKDGDLFIKNQNGELVYEGLESLPIPSEGGVDPSAESATGETMRRGRGGSTFNTMSTPRGGQYQLTLSDGSKVWLNAASSITYPTAFTNKTREVKITGEAYFEIAPNKSKPFIVTTNSDIITVLGTSFNINAYANEGKVKTSLIEGSINVNDINIKPGQAYQNGKKSSTNINQDIAWKNGYFNFYEADLKMVMRQLERWYDIKVNYARDFKGQKIGGKMQRSLKLSEVMEAFSAMGIRYTIKDKNLTIE
jgi:transmembrane sensor